MRLLNFRLASICVALLAPAILVAQDDKGPIESDWLELVKGYKGDAVGVELREIEDGDTEETQKITLAIPKTAISHPDEIEEVVVCGRKPEEPDPIDIQYEWLDDYDNDNYGLVIRLGRNSRWPIRLYMNSDPGFIR